jgi:hypothetical protein
MACIAGHDARAFAYHAMPGIIATLLTGQYDIRQTRAIK